ncbi:MULTISPECIES: DUF952 domain-containing protein [Kaistia]|uniref:DUF952 domain-containing protein n=1 Tax=Kaistia nematophila TaxID=2994654 RepID=A0A9X3IJE0_9HYPH|nr:DUF952 domain-containing protein [Kaistia nematophila]MBN9026833.1 DUF952 domain-containing protein [Hyphomicrobiales bacterium]MCX5568353.1 DUF952 domain-containing protein [Kaistia nematophila]
MTVIFKIAPDILWSQARDAGVFTGATIDITDGFIHLSAADQVRETAARYFGGQSGLVLVAIDGDKLGDKLKWEPSRGGALFPHLYGPLDFSAVIWTKALPVGTDGLHVFPELAA